jgi:flagellar basal body-associated protein FliL
LEVKLGIVANSGTEKRGMWVAIIILLIIFVIAALYFGGMFGRRDETNANRTRTPGMVFLR